MIVGEARARCTALAARPPESVNRSQQWNELLIAACGRCGYGHRLSSSHEDGVQPHAVIVLESIVGEALQKKTKAGNLKRVGGYGRRVGFQNANVEKLSRGEQTLLIA